jgi:hypothetical protein
MVLSANRRAVAMLDDERLEQSRARVDRVGDDLAPLLPPLLNGDGAISFCLCTSRRLDRNDGAEDRGEWRRRPRRMPGSIPRRTQYGPPSPPV